MDLARQNKQLALERDKLQSQLIRATIEKEELLLKYEPGEYRSSQPAGWGEVQGSQGSYKYLQIEFAK